MYCAEKGEFDLLLVWKVDRFFRRTLSLLEYVEYLNDYGVLFKSITQEFATDTSS
jgi:site-specific DNA recombinase